MKVHTIKESTVREYVLANARSRPSFEEFLVKLKYADWEKPADIKDSFSAADLLGKGSNRVVFNVGGNTYRVIAKYAFGDKEVHFFICWIGTHAEYTKICNGQMQYTINIY